MRSSAQPTAALLTPRGRGAVATVRFTGDCRWIDAAHPPLFRAANNRPLSEQPIDRVCFGRWGVDPAEEVVCCRTAADCVEIHCHGGDAAVGRILNDLASRGCAVESWRQASVRESERLDAELTEALTQATTLRTAQILLEQRSGVLRAALEELAATTWTETSQRQTRTILDDLLGWADFGRHLTRPWRVVLMGRPNVGKSSLLNALVGYGRSIVFDQPGTTRDVVTAETAFDGWPVELADTAGLRAEADALEAAGIQLARRQLAAADCRVLLWDTSRPPSEEDFRLWEEWPDAIPVAHKYDLPDVWADRLPSEALRVSAKTGAGVEALIESLLGRLVPKIPPAGTAIPVTDRQVALLGEARNAVLQADQPRFRRVMHELLDSTADVESQPEFTHSQLSH